MEAVIASYRRGRHTQDTSQVILIVNDVDNRDAASRMVGRKVLWKTTSGKELHGEIVSAHGSKGAVRASMKNPLPGQAIGTKISILK
ncbi:MAG: 50S ribosomal protein L35ae [Candidatus Woesearchaeota archaeon]